jgi:hypothetical protein
MTPVTALDSSRRICRTSDDPDTLQRRLKGLLIRYARTPTRALAQAIVECLESLLHHPDFHVAWDERCVYRRMSMEWRIRAW